MPGGVSVPPTEPLTLGARVVHTRGRTGRAILQTIQCELGGECPMWKNGVCQADRRDCPCPFAHTEVVDSIGRRAKSYLEKRSQFEAQAQGLGDWPAPPAELHIAHVGDRILWPYGRTHCQDGRCWVAAETSATSTAWLEADTDLVQLVKDAASLSWTGWGLEKYHQQTVPTMLYHVSVVFPEVFAQLSAELRARRLPTASFKELSAPVAILPTGEYIIGTGPATYRAQWDGETLTVPHASLVGVHSDAPIIATLKPQPSFCATVTDEDEIQRIFESGELVRRWLN